MESPRLEHSWQVQQTMRPAWLDQRKGKVNFKILERDVYSRANFCLLFFFVLRWEKLHHVYADSNDSVEREN